MALSNLNGILLSDLSAFDGISSISAINGISATLGTDVTAPTLSSATVAANGTTLTLVFSEAVSQGAGYADADLNVDASTTGADLSLTYVSGDGTNTWVYTIASTIQSGETVDLDFNGDANSIEDGAGNDLAAIVSFIVTNNSTQGGGPPPDVLWWKFTDGSGTTVTATTGPNGTTDADWVTGKSGSGYALDFVPANSDDVASAAAVTYGAPGVITVAFWLYPDDITSTQVIAESSAVLNSNLRAWLIYLDAGELNVAHNDATATTNVDQSKVTSPSTGAWVHVAVVFDYTSGGSHKIYLDGVSQSLTAVSNNFVGTTSPDDYTLYVGARNSASLFTDGRIDDFRIYGSELSSGDITLVKNDPQ